MLCNKLLQIVLNNIKNFAKKDGMIRDYNI